MTTRDKYLSMNFWLMNVINEEVGSKTALQCFKFCENDSNVTFSSPIKSPSAYSLIHPKMNSN